VKKANHHMHGEGEQERDHQAMGHDMRGAGQDRAAHQHHDHHTRMVADFKRRFWIALVLTVPVLILSPLIQALLGIEDVVSFPGDLIVLWVLSSAIFFYGGLPIEKSGYDDAHRPGYYRRLRV
jgi:Cu2+-exporting ATPase